MKNNPPDTLARSDVQDKMPGTWRWISGQTLQVDAGGSCRVYQGQQQINSCEWTVLDAALRKVRITHKNGGWIDTLTLSKDSMLLEGTNNAGTAILGERISSLPTTVAVDLNGSWNRGDIHIWQDGAEVLVTATWKVDGKYRIFRAEGMLTDNVAHLLVRYSPMTHGDKARWRAVFTVSDDRNRIDALYSVIGGNKTDNRNYYRDS